MDILVFGASYGSLFGVKAAAAGHNTNLICLPEEANLFNAEGAIVRMPVKGKEELITINSKELKGKLTAGSPQDANPEQYDLIVLAMQEPQFSSDGVRDLLDKVGKSGKPTMSIMNMPPLPYLARINSAYKETLAPCYTEAKIWASFNPDCVTLCSPDPQAFRPPEEPLNVLQVRLPTNFKAAAFADENHTALLKQLESDIEGYRHPIDGEAIELPVKLRVHSSLFVPLAKWAMLATGNYRCIGETEMRSIEEAVHSDLEKSRAIYEQILALGIKLGGSAEDFVPFEKYAKAAEQLKSPSSVARALAAGAHRIERVDKIMQALGVANDMGSADLDEIVALVDSWVERNKAKA